MEKRVVKRKQQKRGTQGITTRNKVAVACSNHAQSSRSMKMVREPKLLELLCWNGTLSTLGEIGGEL